MFISDFHLLNTCCGAVYSVPLCLQQTFISFSYPPPYTVLQHTSVPLCLQKMLSSPSSPPPQHNSVHPLPAANVQQWFLSPPPPTHCCSIHQPPLRLQRMFIIPTITLSPPSCPPQIVPQYINSVPLSAFSKCSSSSPLSHYLPLPAPPTQIVPQYINSVPLSAFSKC